MFEESQCCQEDALLLSFGRMVGEWMVSDDEEGQFQCQRTLPQHQKCINRTCAIYDDADYPRTEKGD